VNLRQIAEYPKIRLLVRGGTHGQRKFSRWYRIDRTQSQNAQLLESGQYRSRFGESASSPYVGRRMAEEHKAGNV
jgi:hypothetical protein